MLISHLLKIIEHENQCKSENSVLGHSHGNVNFTVYRAMITKPKVC